MNYPSYPWNEILMYDQYFQMQKTAFHGVKQNMIMPVLKRDSYLKIIFATEYGSK